MTTLKAEPHVASFKWKQLDMHYTPDGGETFKAVVYAKYGSGWSKYDTGMFIWGSPEDQKEIIEDLRQVAEGEVVQLHVTPKLKFDKSDDGQFTSYWWNITGIPDASDAARPASPAPPARATAPRTPPQTAPQAPEPNGGSRAVVRDPTRGSIERQKALDLAGRDYWRYVEFHPDEVPASAGEATRLISEIAARYMWILETGKALGQARPGDAPPPDDLFPPEEEP